jgi:hypothetical protein
MINNFYVLPWIKLTPLPTQIAVSTLSPVSIHTFMPMERAEPTVSITLSCSLSYTPVTPKKSIPLSSFYLAYAIFLSLSFMADAAWS